MALSNTQQGAASGAIGTINNFLWDNTVGVTVKAWNSLTPKSKFMLKVVTSTVVLAPIATYYATKHLSPHHHKKILDTVMGKGDGLPGQGGGDGGEAPHDMVKSSIDATFAGVAMLASMLGRKGDQLAADEEEDINIVLLDKDAQSSTKVEQAPAAESTSLSSIATAARAAVDANYNALMAYLYPNAAANGQTPPPVADPITTPVATTEEKTVQDGDDDAARSLEKDLTEHDGPDVLTPVRARSNTEHQIPYSDQQDDNTLLDAAAAKDVYNLVE